MVSSIYSTRTESILYGLADFTESYYYSLKKTFENLLKPLFRRGPGRKIQLVLRVTIIPALIVLAYLYMYSAGSKEFSLQLGSVFGRFSEILIQLLQHVNGTALVLMITGALFSTFMFIKAMNRKHHKGVDFMIRRRNLNKGVRNLALKYEYSRALILFTTLNILLALFLFVEIDSYWFNYKWDGEFLKGTVHQGTYVLIFSIVTSIALALFYFRGNLNFYPRNRLLKTLAFIWIFLNIVLVISVAVRNTYYVQYFALAHKRIAVYFFLFFCVIGLITLWLKVKHKKTLYYVLRINSMVVFMVLGMVSLINWDRTIAKYNIAHSDHSFLHLDYMLDLDNDALPLLDLSDAEMAAISDLQVRNIPFASADYFKTSEYSDYIEKRIRKFKRDYENKSVLSRTWSERSAYVQLSRQ